MVAGEDEAQPVAHRWLWKAAIVFHVVVGLMPYLGTGLLAPPAGVAVLWGLWAAGAVLIWRLRSAPRLAIWIPLAAILVWVAVITVGDVLLGWAA